MQLIDRIRREIAFLKPLARTLRLVNSIRRDSPVLACDDLERAVDRFAGRTALVCEGRTLSFAAFDAMANRFANWAREERLRRGQVVGLLLPNRLEYLPAWYGLSKVGVITALINNQLAGPALAHCLKVSGAAHVIVDDSTAGLLEAVRPTLERPVTVWTLGSLEARQRDLSKALKGASSVRPDRSVRDGLTAGDTALYIFTSGTTGLPKAACMTHMRVQLYMRGFQGATGARPNDRIYCALPLYHATGGLCAAGGALLNGAAFVISREFHASRFWAELIAARATMFVYIGELCRYLANQPERPEERAHTIRKIFGNGLRPDVWPKMTGRFGIAEIVEFYGATEGNVSMFNFDGRPGAIGRAPWYLRGRFNVRLIRFDVEKEAPMRGPDGLCVECAPGEIGECVGEIGQDARSSYAGYADKAASEKKVLRDVLQRGDAWFATGDLMWRDRDGYFYFVDRIGDTFRWKGENVSTTEVSGRLAQAPGVGEAIVYGVEVAGHDGRAGMAALVVGPSFDLAGFGARVARELPDYAQPRFLRLQTQVETTGTFKYRRTELVAEGFDPARVAGELYWRDPAAGYLRMTPQAHAALMSGGQRL